MSKPNAKSLITGAEPINEGIGDEQPPHRQGPPGGRPPGPPGGPRGMRGGPGAPGRAPGGPEEPQGMLSRQERAAMKDLVLLDLVSAMGGDPFYKSLVDMAIKGTDPDPAMIRHFMDEAPKFAKEMPPHVNELMGKLFNLPKQ
jgi:hypothetical protein